MKIILEMLSYPFLVRALVVGVLVSLCASLLGVSLVLKRYSMIGDGLRRRLWRTCDRSGVQSCAAGGGGAGRGRGGVFAAAPVAERQAQG